MEPSFSDGDHVLTFKSPNLKKNDVVVFTKSEFRMIKRVKELGVDSVIVESDNKSLAKKSYKVLRLDIIGKVIFKF